MQPLLSREPIRSQTLLHFRAKIKSVMKSVYLVLIFTFLINSCSPSQNKSTTTQNPDSPITVGAILSLTGYASLFGENSQKGMQLAVEEINAKGGINGRPFKILYEDDGTNSKNAVTSAEKLLEQDQVVALLGGTWDLSLEPIVPIAEKHDTLLITPSTGNTNPAHKLSPILFRTWPSIKTEVQTFQPILKKEKILTVALFRNSGSWALSHKHALEQILDKQGGTLVADFSGTEIDNNNFHTEITKLSLLKPDAIFLAVGKNDATQIIRWMKEQNVTVQILATDGSLNSALQSNLVTREQAEHAYYLNLDPDDTTNAAFIKKFETRFHKQPGISADTAYLAVKVLAEAYQSTGTTDTKIVREYLEKSGTFDTRGDREMIVPVYHIENGKSIRME